MNKLENSLRKIFKYYVIPLCLLISIICMVILTVPNLLDNHSWIKWLLLAVMLGIVLIPFGIEYFWTKLIIEDEIKILKEIQNLHQLELSDLLEKAQNQLIKELYELEKNQKKNNENS